MNEYYNQRYESLREQFRARCRSDADRLEACFADEADLETVEMLLHRLAGAGATFGYPDVSTLGKQLENLLIDEGRVPPEKQAEIITLLRSLS